MLDLTRRRRLLKLLSLWDRAAAFIKGHGRGRRAADRNLAEFYAQVWREAADQLGAAIEPLGLGAFEIRLGDQHTRVLENSTALDDLATHCLVRTKPVVYRLLAAEGLPVPRHVVFTVEDMQEAAAFLEAADRPCVVKPASGTGGGLAVTTGVRTRWQLARAAWAACAHGGSALIEEQAEGKNYRLLYLDGRLLDSVVRHPPTVTGTGTHTIARLVEEANAQRLLQSGGVSHGLLTIDLDLRRTLGRQGLALGSVPAAGTVVTLKTVINENRGQDNESATHLLGSAIIADGARAAAIAGVRLAGVDIVTPDPGVPLREAGGVILEVNSPPGYFWHYRKRDGAFPVAVHVLQCLLGVTAPESCLRRSSSRASPPAAPYPVLSTTEQSL
jgi:cyanophycin synthetase